MFILPPHVQDLPAAPARLRIFPGVTLTLALTLLAALLGLAVVRAAVTARRRLALPLSAKAIQVQEKNLSPPISPPLPPILTAAACGVWRGVHSELMGPPTSVHLPAQPVPLLPLHVPCTPRQVPAPRIISRTPPARDVPRAPQIQHLRMPAMRGSVAFSRSRSDVALLRPHGLIRAA
ncbi:hypothetical protein DFH09DRAFT_1078586 [Mycena vulgaris]|nr:hypothetical protein DFH09DRAFT_1078586 [Mycena vulgaris]